MVSNASYVDSAKYAEKAAQLFLSREQSQVAEKMTKYQFLKAVFLELIYFIPRYFQRRYFIEDFTRKVAVVSQERIEFDNDSQRMIETCAKKLAQLHSLHKVYLLIAKEFDYEIPFKLELGLKHQIVEYHKCLNKSINAVESLRKCSSLIMEDAAGDELTASDPETGSGNVVIDSDEPLENDLPEEKSSSSDDAVTESSAHTFWKKVKMWSGAQDIGDCVEELKSGNYRESLSHLGSASVRMVVSAALTACAVGVLVNIGRAAVPITAPAQTEPQWRSPTDIPYVAKAQIHSEITGQPKHDYKITFITAYDEGIRDYAQHVIPNQRAFAQKHGYDYVEYFGNLAQNSDPDLHRAPYWSKIVALQDRLDKTQAGDWIVWGDASVLFTNTAKNFDQIIERYGSNKDVIVTSDPQEPINNAVFLIKNTPWTKNWIRKVWGRSDLSVGGKGRCWLSGQPFCHYEQQAMTELWQSNFEVQGHTAVIPNKEMNSFYRYSHYDPYRQLKQEYEGDPADSRWTAGDFVCKVTGMDKDRRLAIIQYVAANCIDRPCEWQEF